MTAPSPPPRDRLPSNPLPDPVTAYDRMLHAFLVDCFEALPVHGTMAGYHLVDGRWPDLSEEGRLARLALYARHRAAAVALDQSDLAPDERVDRAILVELLDKLRFGDDVLRDEAWDPMSLVYLVGSGLFGIDGQYDFVRATFTDGSNVPRIPPQRLGGGVYWRNANWLARVNLLHAFSQNDVSANETGTPGYDNLRAQISYTEKLKNDPSGIKQFTVGISGDNLLDQAMRNAVSYTKNEVLMPGRTVRVFASVKY